tara:strand:- start:2129 stop:2848 length:720 start_codon:yes stop_codon:yes gene_type:complete
MRIKCVIAAGGLGTRLQGFRDNDKTKVLLEVNSMPMINQQINQLKQWGVEEFVIVTSPNFDSLIREVTSQAFPDLTINYTIQDNPKGISHAFSKAEQYICTGDTVIFVLGDNFFEENLTKEVDFNKFSNEGGCIIFTKKVTNPNEFGVATVDNLGNVMNIEEKPAKPKSNLAVVGLYIFDSLAMSKIKKLSPSSRGEYEITDLINMYINEKKCTNVEFDGWWVDAGTPDRIIELENLLP